MGRLARSFGKSEKSVDDSGTAVDELCSDIGALAVKAEPPPPAQPVRGLKNLGNSCYLNSVLQSLLAAEPFRLYLVRDAVVGEGPTTTALRAWAKQMHNQGTGVVAPSKVLQAVCRRHKRFAGRSQQDAQEVLRHLLELVRLEEVERLKPKEACDDSQHDRSKTRRLSRVTSRLPILRRNRGESREDMLAKVNAEEIVNGGVAADEDARPSDVVRLSWASVDGGEDETAPDELPLSADEAGSAGETESETSHSSGEAAASPAGAKRPKPEPDTLVDDVFRGKLRSTVVCLSCKAISASHEPFLDLSLHLPRGTAEAQPAQSEPPHMADKTQSQKYAARRQQLILQQLEEGEGEGGPEPGASDVEGGSGEGLLVDANQLAKGESARQRRRFSARGPLERGAWREWRDVGIEACAEQVLCFLPKERVGTPGAAGLVTCVQAFTQPELLRDADAYECEKCVKEWKRMREAEAPANLPPAADARSSKGAASDAVCGEREPAPPRQPALKFIELVSLPPVLTLHLKRFAVNARATQKVATHVPFPLELNLAPFCGPRESPETLAQLVQPQPGGSRYALVGVVEHRGSFMGGHYVAYVRSSAEPGRWHYFSDTHVREATEATVLAAQAFLLFYARV